MDKQVSVNRAVLMGFCGLLASTAGWADPPREGQFQTDQLQDDQPQPKHKKRSKYLQYVTRLYDQELHVLAGPDIQSIEDLKGKKVNFGLPDSRTYTTATAVFRTLDVEPDVMNLPHPLALDRLRRGEISALAYVATKP